MSGETDAVQRRLWELAPLAVAALQDIAATGKPRDRQRAQRTLRAYGLDRVQQSGSGAGLEKGPQAL